MIIDLPPLSAFTPDPAVARARAARDTLTLSLQPTPGAALARYEVMSGTVNTGPFPADGADSSRVTVGSAEEAPLTITF